MQDKQKGPGLPGWVGPGISMCQDVQDLRSGARGGQHVGSSEGSSCVSPWIHAVGPFIQYQARDATRREVGFSCELHQRELHLEAGRGHPYQATPDRAQGPAGRPMLGPCGYSLGGGVCVSWPGPLPGQPTVLCLSPPLVSQDSLPNILFLCPSR